MSWSEQALKQLQAGCWDSVHLLANDFEDRWLKGETPDLETCLPLQEPLRSSVLLELVRIDMEQRLRRGQTVRTEDYVARFDELQREEELQLELAVWEFRLLRRAGASSDDLCRRFPRLAKRLRDLLPPHFRSQRWFPPGFLNAKKLGEGGMGEVWLADQLDPPRQVALKVIRAFLADNRQAVERFRREADILKQLNHPNVIQIYDIDTHEGRPYYTMEFCRDGDLSLWLNGTELPADEAAKLIETLATTIHSVHDRGIVHRDLKPTNVLMRTNPETMAASRARAAGDESMPDVKRPLPSFIPMVTDFGLAQSGEDSALTYAGQELGTPAYMAPEQARGEANRVGPATDIWSLGAILYECLTGRVPFHADTRQGTLKLVREQEPVPPRQRNPMLHRDLQTICLKCLEKDSRHRYATALELANDLRSWLSGDPIHARPPSFLERALRMTRREPRLAVAGLLLLLSLVALTYIAWGFRQSIETLTTVGKDLQKERHENTEQQLQLYMSHLSLAKRSLDNENHGEAYRYLQACPKHLRGWEWQYLARKCSLCNRLQAHDRYFHCMTFSHNGEVLATGGGALNRGQGVAKLWDATGKALQTELVYAGAVRNVAFSSNGLLACAVACYEPEKEVWGEVKIWDPATREEVQTLRDGFIDVNGLCFDPRGTMLASGGTRRSPITGQDCGKVKLWKVTAERELLQDSEFEEPLPVFSVSFSPNGQFLACSSGTEGSIHAGIVNIREVTSFKVILALREKLPVTTITFSPDGRLLAGIVVMPFRGERESVLKLWDASTGNEVATIRGQNARSVSAISFHPDGKSSCPFYAQGRTD